ncbi:MAG: hypothetical protein IJV98_05560 [Clostridia bacterium]|nr:hypothetical protein [Clostridia bacterium]
MKIGYILAGMIFLFNPHINIVDVLPDVIGYILILHGLFKISDLERNLQSARRRFLNLAWLSAAKLACLLITPIFDETLYLIFTFCFGLLEMMWMIPAFIDLFAGIAFLEDRHTSHRTRFDPERKSRFGGVLDKTDFADGRVYFEVYEKNKQNGEYPADEERVRFPGGEVTVCASYEGFVARDEKKTPYFYASDEARVISVIFVIVRALCACLPEVTALMSTGDSYVHSHYTNNYSGLRILLSAVLALVALAVGIVWLCRMVKYFRVFMNDTPFLAALSARYEAEVVPNKPLWIKRGTLAFCLFSTVALAFMTCVRLSIGNITDGDGVLIAVLEAVYIVPEFLFGVMMVLAFRRVRAYYPAYRESVKRTWLFTGVSLAAYVLMFYISATYGRTVFPYQELKYCILFGIYLLIFAASMMLFVSVCREKERAYATLVEEVARVVSPEEHEYAKKRRAHMMDEFRPRLRGLTAASIAYAVFSVVCMAAVPFAEDYAACGLSWLFRTAFCIFVIVKSVLLTDKLEHEIEKVID